MASKNEHKKLQQLADERADVYLSEQFKALIDEAEQHVEQIKPKDLYVSLMIN